MATAKLGDNVVREEKCEAFKQDTLRTWWNHQENGLHLTLEEADICLAKLAAGEGAKLPFVHTEAASL